ncbi:MAG TPA: cell division protein ZipA C-terminal FtsZ-binding domain-containing protein [Candidatus Binatia bacterium]|nr:cell division protein ZipA C-terminal FtsZ-binding domain-containing protein [Candidatus Binatia bacterium]
MTTLQWALLLLGGGIIAALLLSGRREKKALERLGSPPPPGGSGRDWAQRQAVAADDEAAESFDEYGVGRPRKRSAPGIAPAAAPAAPAARAAAAAAPAMRPGRQPPSFVRPGAETPQAKVVGLYIAEHEGTSILGPRIHAALQAEGLRFGARSIYHRLDAAGQVQFSVAALTKPGHLDPAQAQDFATPGLSVFMALPGPAQPAAALTDLLRTAHRLAQALNAQLFDSELREPLSEERARSLVQSVEEWTRLHGA